MMNPFQLGLLNVTHRMLRREDVQREYGPMVLEGLLAHQFVEYRGQRLAVTPAGRRALADFESEVDRK